MWKQGNNLPFQDVVYFLRYNGFKQQEWTSSLLKVIGICVGISIIKFPL